MKLVINFHRQKKNNIHIKISQLPVKTMVTKMHTVEDIHIDV